MDIRSDFVVDTDRLSRADRAGVVRSVIDLLAPAAVTYECDVPLAQQATWPPAVRGAASVLSSLRAPKKRDGIAYHQTGVQERGDVAVWDAFVVFAAYAYDASVRDVSGQRLIDLADEGTSLVAAMTAAEADSIRTEHVVPVVPLLSVNPADLAAVAKASQRVARLLDDRLKPDGLTVFQANRQAGWQDVFHLHFHVVPRWKSDPLRLPWKSEPASPEHIATIAARLAPPRTRERSPQGHTKRAP